jgi:S1-C subfamily serine protease
MRDATIHSRTMGCVLALLASVGALAATAPQVTNDDGTRATRAADAQDIQGLDAERLYAALVHVEATAVPNARSNATLGREREGTGTVISKDGMILTIGYLLVEADQIKVTDNRGRSYSARMVAYDHPTGLALLKTTTPINVTPVPFGNSGKLADREPVLIAGWGGIPDTALAYVVSRRMFTGSWEYMLDEAIFTSPPTTGWSGAALVDRRGTIVGVGSLVVRDATEGEPKLPGNMFVPIDALKPILDDMMKTGRRKEPPRPWLGVSADEISGRLIVTRVSPDSPASRAGLQPGDVVLGVGGQTVSGLSDFYRKMWARGPAGTAIPLDVLQVSQPREITVKSTDRASHLKLKRTF